MSGFEGGIKSFSLTGSLSMVASMCKMSMGLGFGVGL